MRFFTGALAVILLGVASASSYVSAPQRTYLPPAPQVYRPAVSHNYVARPQLVPQYVARPQNVYLPPPVHVQRPVKSHYRPATQVISYPRTVQHASVQRPAVHHHVVQQQFVQPHNVYLPPPSVVHRPTVSISRPHQISSNYYQQSPARTYLPPQAAASNQYEQYEEPAADIDLRGDFQFII